MKLKELKNELFKTERGIELKKRFNRILIYSIILIAFGICFLIDAIKNPTFSAWLYTSFLLIFGIGFIIARHIVIKKQVIAYGVRKKEKERKKKK